MALEIILLVTLENDIRLLNVTGFSVESNERLEDEIESLLYNDIEALTISKIVLHLYGEYPGTSWSILIRYASGKTDGRLTYVAPGDGEAMKEASPEVERVSRYTRKPVI